jgi:hypothetical protein
MNPAEDDCLIRKIRKRETDRRAQRGHRKRHKAYVQELENEIRTLKNQHTCDERVASLQRENERLRGLCNKLHSHLEKVRLAVAADEDEQALRVANSLESANVNSNRLATPSQSPGIPCDSEDPCGGVTVQANDSSHGDSPVLEADFLDATALHHDISQCKRLVIDT